MTQLFAIIFTLASTVLMGICITIVLTLAYGTANAIIGAALIGFILAIPIAWVIASKLFALKKQIPN